MKAYRPTPPTNARYSLVSLPRLFPVRPILPPSSLPYAGKIPPKRSYAATRQPRSKL